MLPEVGQQLPELGIDISTRLVVAGAIATRDYQDVHHDKDAARELGTPDIFMNIMTTQGLVGRYLSDWMEEGVRLERLDIRLGVPNFPGDRMLLNGEVLTVDTESREVVVAVRGQNGIGEHVTGTANLRFPAG